MLPYLSETDLSETAHNPSSLHWEGRRARAALEEAREQAARAIGAKAREIVFVGSGSEADTPAILGAAQQRPGRHIISCAIEHRAVLRALDALRDQGYEITLLPVDHNGLVDPQRFEHALRPQTALASVMCANNEVCTIEPISQLAEIARRRSLHL